MSDPRPRGGACGPGPGPGEDVPGRHPLPRRRLQRLQFPLVVHRAEMLNAREPGRGARTTWGRPERSILLILAARVLHGSRYWLSGPRLSAAGKHTKVPVL